MLASAVQTVVFLVSGLLTSYAATRIYLSLFRQHCYWIYVSYGLGMFFLGTGLQSLVALPVALVVHGPSVLVPFRNLHFAEFQLLELVYYALAAGTAQETAKLAPLWLELRRGRQARPRTWLVTAGINVGLGFSAAEILFVAVRSWQPHLALLTGSAFALSVAERFSVTLFHIGTAGLLGYSLEHNKLWAFLPGCILAHALLDGFATFINQRLLLSATLFEVLVFFFSFAVVATTLALVRSETRQSRIQQLPH